MKMAFPEGKAMPPAGIFSARR